MTASAHQPCLKPARHIIHYRKLLGKLALTAGTVAAVLAAPLASGAVTFTTIYSFSPYAATDAGIEPVAGLALGGDGNFYGTTTGGGANGPGTVFRATPSGSETTLYSFDIRYDGGEPRCALVLGNDGNFYGTTSDYHGSGLNNQGTVFRISTGGAFAVLATFNGTNGAEPFGGLVVGADSNFYGTTSSGGASGSGTVFKMTPSGTLTTLHSFSGGTSDGGCPKAGLVQGNNGDFYGVTTGEDTFSSGTVFKITAAGVLTTLHRFGSDGIDPYGGLVLGTDGNFYGTTSAGGAHGDGTVFKITPTGSLATLHNFAGNDGSQPLAALAQGSDGNFYGTTTQGGANIAKDPLGVGFGAVFRITPRGTLSTLYSFGQSIDSNGNPVDGGSPMCALVQTPDGSFYGTTLSGGSGGYNCGTIFQISGASSPAGPIITTASPLPEGALGVVYSQTLAATGGTPPYAWSLVSGALPAGLSLSSAGVISGTPGTAKTASSKVKVTDESGLFSTKVFSLTISRVPAAKVYTWMNFAGQPENSGSVDGTGGAAKFNGIWGLALDGEENLFVSDSGNDTIRKVTSAGVVTTLAGSAVTYGDGQDGTGSNAHFYSPSGVTTDNAGNLYVADTYDYTIRKVTPAGVVTTLAGSHGIYGSADGTGSAALFMGPKSVAVDSASNVFVADTFDSTIRKVSPVGTNWVVTTLAGSSGLYGHADGTGTEARFASPSSIAVDSEGNLFVTDTGYVYGAECTVRKVTSAGVVTTLSINTGQYSGPQAVAVDTNGNLYLMDTEEIWKAAPLGTNWVLTELAGCTNCSHGSADGTGNAAQFYTPSSLALDSAGNIFLADTWNGTVRKVSPEGTNWVVTTLAGSAGNYGSTDGRGSAAEFSRPEGVALDSAGNLFVTDGVDNLIRKVTPAGVVTTFAGFRESQGHADGMGSVARFNEPEGVAVDKTDNVYAVDNDQIRKVTPAGLVSTMDQFNIPTGVAVDSAGNLFVTVTDSSTIAEVTPAGVVTTVAGTAGAEGSNDGVGSAALFLFPQGVALDSAGNLFVSDTGNNTIRKVAPVGTNWVVTTLAGNPTNSGSADGMGSAAQFWHPLGLAVDSEDNVYVADRDNFTIRKVTPAGVVTTIGGVAGTQGCTEGTGNAAQFVEPTGVTVDSAGNLFVADWTRIIKGMPSITPNDGLSLLINDAGTVQHGSWPATLVIGKKYTVTAAPKPGNVFCDWVGGTNSPYSVLSESSTYTFTMRSNLVLEANFIPNPFLPVKGTYNGLFFNTSNGVTEQMAGMLRGLGIGQNGTYSGTLLINGGCHAMSGAFDAAGQATNHIARPASQGGPLTVEMKLNWNDSPPDISGVVLGTNNGIAWTAPLLAGFATNSLRSAEYTMLILPDTNSAPANSPGGDGYALITNHLGKATITGALADGTAFSQSVPVSQDGYVPVYANLYGNKGLLLGWVNLDVTNTTNVGLTWIRPEQSSGLYSNGFTNVLLTNQIPLSPWTNPPAGIFAATNLCILDTINDTNALMDFTITISNNCKLGEISGAMPVSGCINLKTGLLKVTIGSGAGKTNGYGAILLNATNGGGFFVNKASGGAVLLQP
ncbi:MAG: choice-of-anchor tandem repeat GloVer-containing protein [Limisphaerales bacterium]